MFGMSKHDFLFFPWSRLRERNTMLIQANMITKKFSTTPVFEGLTLAIHPGDKIGLVGMNGCGKSTLLRKMGLRLTSEPEYPSKDLFF